MKTYGISAVSIIVNNFVTQIISNTERTKRFISLSSIRAHGQLQLSIREKRVDIIAISTGSSIRLGVTQIIL